MQFAIIHRPQGAISIDEWTRLVETHPALVAALPRTGINPFTGAEVHFERVGVAHVMLEGSVTGNAVLEHGRILTTGIPVAICEEIARRLQAVVAEDDRS